MPSRKSLFLVTGALFVAGVAAILTGALYKIQSWRLPEWLGVDLLLIGVLLLLFAMAALLAALFLNQSKPDAETELVLKDLPETVPEAEAQLRRDEDMIV